MARPLGSIAPLEIRRLVRRSLLAICLDVDGTLAPIVARPDLARVPLATRRLIRRLRMHPGVIVTVVSGRRAAEARAVVGTAVDWTIGNHGLEVARGAGPPRPIVAARLREVTRRARERIARALGGLKGVQLEDKGWTLALHLRGRGGELPPRIWRQVRAAARGAAVYLRRGKQVIDVRPARGWDKGTALRALLRRIGGASWAGTASVIYAGDDITDEDAFRGLPRSVITIKVGPGLTRARFRTRSPATLAAWLTKVERALRRRTA